MVSFIKWLTFSLTTVLTMLIGVFIAGKRLDAADDWMDEIPVYIEYFVFILPLSVVIGVMVGAVLSVFVIPLILKEKPPPPNTPPQLICGKCNNISTDSWQWQYCTKCGNSLKKKSSNLLFIISAVILVVIVIGVYNLVPNQHEKAIDDYTKVIERHTDLSSNESKGVHYFNRGLAYIRLEQYDKALKDLDKAIELSPGYRTDALELRRRLLEEHPELKP
tara:strand:+ start:115 stop:774 length:660 start_codon:yes stop_codon:yes gene_type:complete